MVECTFSRKEKEKRKDRKRQSVLSDMARLRSDKKPISQASEIVGRSIQGKEDEMLRRLS